MPRSECRSSKAARKETSSIQRVINTSPILTAANTDDLAFTLGIQHQRAKPSATDTGRIHTLAPSFDAKSTSSIMSIDHHLRLVVFFVTFVGVTSIVSELVFSRTQHIANETLPISVQIALLSSHNSARHRCIEFAEAFSRLVTEQAIVVPIPDISPRLVVASNFLATLASTVGGRDVRLWV